MSTKGMSKRQQGFMYLNLLQAAEEKRLAEQQFTEEERKKIEEARRKARRGARGRAGTILTSGLGIMEPPPTEQKRLLGE